MDYKGLKEIIKNDKLEYQPYYQKGCRQCTKLGEVSDNWVLCENGLWLNIRPQIEFHRQMNLDECKQDLSERVKFFVLYYQAMFYEERLRTPEQIAFAADFLINSELTEQAEYNEWYYEQKGKQIGITLTKKECYYMAKILSLDSINEYEYKEGNIHFKNLIKANNIEYQKGSKGKWQT